MAVALMKAFLAVHGTSGAASAQRARDRRRADRVRDARRCCARRPAGGTFHIEDVQDHVELALMRGGHHEVARAYVLYRERRTQERARQGEPQQRRRAGVRRSSVTDNGVRVPLDLTALHALIDVGLREPGRRREAGPDPGRDASATCTTACRSTRCTRPPSWPPAP